jgi:hypothetical protein
LHGILPDDLVLFSRIHLSKIQTGLGRASQLRDTAGQQVLPGDA